MGKFVPVVAVLLLFTVVQASAEGGKVCVFFFYGVGCPDCSKVELYITQLEQGNLLNILIWERFQRES